MKIGNIKYNGTTVNVNSFENKDEQYVPCNMYKGDVLLAFPYIIPRSNMIPSIIENTIVLNNKALEYQEDSQTLLVNNKTVSVLDGILRL